MDDRDAIMDRFHTALRLGTTVSVGLQPQFWVPRGSRGGFLDGQPVQGGGPSSLEHSCPDHPHVQTLGQAGLKEIATGQRAENQKPQFY